MKAMLARRWGDPKDLEFADVPEPAPGAGDVLIDVQAIGCNFPDILIVQGKYQKRPPLPFSPGIEVSGAVRACGAGVTRFRPGDRVFALIGSGGYAESVTYSSSSRTSSLVLRVPVQNVKAALSRLTALGTIVSQNLSVLTRGNTLKPRVLLLGGPNTYLPFLQACWRQRIPAEARPA